MHEIITRMPNRQTIRATQRAEPSQPVTDGLALILAADRWRGASIRLADRRFWLTVDRAVHDQEVTQQAVARALNYSLATVRREIYRARRATETLKE